MVRIPTATIAAGLVLLFVLLNPRGATADDWYVFPPGVPANAGEPDIPASQVFPTIQAAVDAPSVEDRDRVILADPTQEGSDGTFFGDGNQNVALTKALRIRSESGAPEECNVFAQGPPPRRHFFISGHEADGASFQGINFRGGNAVGFDGEQGSSNGGSIYCEDVSDLFVLFCIFDHNYAGINGGAIYFLRTSDIEIVHCFFDFNGAGAQIYNGGGGALYLEDSSAGPAPSDPGIRFSWFDTNVAQDGGAICLRSSSSALIQHCRFQDNGTSPSEEPGSGGAIYFGASDGEELVVEGGWFRENSANLHGGAIAAFSIEVDGQSSVRISDVEFTKNETEVGVDSDGGAIYLNDHLSDPGMVATVVDCRLEWNKTYGDGGGIYANACSTTIRRCYFNENQTFGSRGGGAIFHRSRSQQVLHVGGCDIVHNWALGPVASGAGIYVCAVGLGGRVAIQNSNICYNSSEDEGGGLHISGLTRGPLLYETRA